jgi:TonB family protein
MKRCILLILLLVVLAGSVTASNDTKQQSEDLVKHAEEKSNILALPSFEMKANVRIDNQGKPLDGSYMFLWNGPEQWREEISFPGYSEVHVGGRGVVFLKRSTEFIPLRIDQLHSALNYGRHSTDFVHIPPGSYSETVKKIRERTVNGSKAVCAEVLDHESHTREVCVDGSTGALLRQRPFLDRELMPVGGKLFPRFLSYVEDGKPLAEVQVTELKASERLPSSAFEPPREAAPTPGCIEPSVGHLVKKVQPRYPEAERQSRTQGTVVIYAVMGKDGIPGHLRIVSRVTPGLEKASLDAVQQWRYEPATCNGIPVDVEFLVTVNFHLQ